MSLVLVVERYSVAVVFPSVIFVELVFIVCVEMLTLDVGKVLSVIRELSKEVGTIDVGCVDVDVEVELVVCTGDVENSVTVLIVEIDDSLVTRVLGNELGITDVGCVDVLSVGVDVDTVVVISLVGMVLPVIVVFGNVLGATEVVCCDSFLEVISELDVW